MSQMFESLFKGTFTQIPEKEILSMSSKKKKQKDPEEEYFTLSRMEYYYLQRLMNNAYLGMIMTPQIYREYELAWNNDKYPFREESEDFVIGVTVELMPL